jgi:hypothetical protein
MISICCLDVTKTTQIVHTHRQSFQLSEQRNYKKKTLSMQIKFELHTSVGCKKNSREVWLIPIDCCKKSYELTDNSVICFSYHG